MNVKDLSVSLQKKLGEVANRLAKKTGFIQRQRKVTGANFIQTLVFGWLAKANASLTELVSHAELCGLDISAQGLDKRFTPEAADFCQGVLEEMLQETVVAQEAVQLELLHRFSQVRLIDTTVTALPEVLRGLWPGTGGSTAQANQAALKVEVAFDLKQGTLQGSLMAGKTNDSRGCLAQAPVLGQSLQIADLGYFSLERMAQLHEQGAYWLSRLKHDTRVYDGQGQPLNLLKILPRTVGEKAQLRVYLGDKRVPARLFAYRVGQQVAVQRRRQARRSAQKKGRAPTQLSLQLCGWTLLITNTEKISIDEALVLHRSRWQVELIFKTWKQHMHIDQSVSHNPQRMLCELYLKLLAALVQHWIVQSSSCWQLPNKSLVKAYKVIASRALHIVSVFNCLQPLRRMLKKLTDCVTKLCRQNQRKKKCNAWKELDRGAVQWAA